MTGFFHLVKVFLINLFRLDKSQKKIKIILYTVLTVCFLPILIGACAAVFFAGKHAAESGMDISSEFVSSIYTVGMIVTFFFGLITMLQIVFFDKDAEFLLSLPFSPTRIFSAKLIAVYTTEVSVSLFFALPLPIVFGIGLAAGGGSITVLYFLSAVVMPFILPLLPLLVIALLTVPLMYLVSFFKRKSMLSLVAGIALFAAFFVVYFTVVGRVSNAGAEIGEGGEIDPNAFVESMILSFSAIGRYLYPIRFFTDFMFLKNAALNLLYFVLSLSALFAAVFFLSSKFYAKSMRGQIEHAASRSSKRKGYRLESRSLRKALLIKEIKMLSRDTGFAFQSYLGAIMAPLFIVFYNVSGILNMGGGSSAIGVGIALFLSYFFGIMFSAGMNYTAFAAFTREGKTFYINKYLPVPYAEIFRAKARFAWIVSCTGIVLGAIAVAVVLAVKGEAIWSALLNAVLFAGAGAALSFSLNRFGLRRDLKRPTLDWNNVKEALKSNTYLMFPMLIAVGASLIPMIVGIVFAALAEVGLFPRWVAYLVFWLFAYMCALIVYLAIGRKKEEDLDALFNRIEC
ncbi:MAG: hypothetical protein LBT20_02045 [Clostridiales bacterium]|jgi:ABC-2 type transport system permease protein|nr:hypothetical protein [Clostridiales bacterium]